MKTLILLLFTFSISVRAQKIDKPYRYPVKPGTKEWAKLTSSDQMDEVCVIPQEILDSMTTRALLITCLNYPRVIDIFMMNDLQTGFDFYSKHFNGLEEFIKRPDVGQALFQSYLDLDINLAKQALFNFDISSFRIAFFEIMISQEKFINAFKKNEKELLLSKSIRVLEERQLLGESLFHQKTSGLIISRILTSENKNLSETDKYGNDIFKIFNSNAILADSALLEKLLTKAKSVLNNW